MSEVKRYHVVSGRLCEGVPLGMIGVVLVADFDRVTAERDALQQRLTAADERVDVLEADRMPSSQMHGGVQQLRRHVEPGDSFEMVRGVLKAGKRICSCALLQRHTARFWKASGKRRHDHRRRTR